MITGAHSVIYSSNSKADRTFFRDVLKLTNVDVGEGWLIFGLPPSEIAVHPSSDNGLFELYLMCDDIKAFVQEMGKLKIVCSSIQNQAWGLVTQLTLPGGGKLGVYQPTHARPKPMILKDTNKKKATGIAPKKKARNKTVNKKIKAK